MPEFTYCGDEGRVYPSLPAPANSPEPGQTYKLADDPGDGRWAKPDKHDTKTKPDKPADPAPAGDTKE